MASSATKLRKIPGGKAAVEATVLAPPEREEVALLAYMYSFWLPPAEAVWERERRRRQYFPQPERRKKRRRR